MKETAGLISQVIHDLIGRVVPGAATLLVCLFLCTDSTHFEAAVRFAVKDPGVPLTLVIGAGLLASYLLGTLLGAIGFAVTESELLKIRLPVVKAYEPEHELGAIIDQEHAPYVHDYIHIRDPATGARLAKLHAEMHMCRALVAGCVVVFLAYLVFFVLHISYSGLLRFAIVVPSLQVTVVSSFLLYRHLDVRSRRLTVNAWTILRQDEERSRLGQAAPAAAGQSDEEGATR